MITFRLPFAVLLPSLVFLLSASSAGAQVVQGSVLTDSGSVPIAEAEVSALDERGGRIGRPVRTDSAGQFVIRGVTGRIQLRAQRVGFALTESPVLVIGEDETLIVELFMRPTVAPLLPVRIVERRRGVSLTALDELTRRMESTPGTFITRAEIERRNPQSFVDLLHGMAGLQVVQGPLGPTVQMRRAPTSIRSQENTCTPRFYLDGVLLSNTGIEPINMLGVASLYAIEIYRGSSTVPAEFGGSAGQCGVIVVWTNRSAPPP